MFAFSRENFQDARDGDKVTAQKNFEDYIIGKIIVTRYNSRNYRVDDVDWRQSPTSSFTKSGGQEVRKKSLICTSIYHLFEKLS